MNLTEFERLKITEKLKHQCSEEELEQLYLKSSQNLDKLTQIDKISGSVFINNEKVN